MAPRICVDPTPWKSYFSGRKKYKLQRSCKYDSTPGEPSPPSVGNLPPCLTVWIFVREFRAGEEEPITIGKISILAYRGTWNDIAHLNNEDEANNQLQRAADSARNGLWEIEPLTRMLNQGFEEIQRQINNYENNGAEIAGEFLLQ